MGFFQNPIGWVGDQAAKVASAITPSVIIQVPSGEGSYQDVWVPAVAESQLQTGTKLEDTGVHWQMYFQAPPLPVDAQPQLFGGGGAGSVVYKDEYDWHTRSYIRYREVPVYTTVPAVEGHYEKRWVPGPPVNQLFNPSAQAITESARTVSQAVASTLNDVGKALSSDVAKGIYSVATLGYYNIAEAVANTAGDLARGEDVGSVLLETPGRTVNVLANFGGALDAAQLATDAAGAKDFRQGVEGAEKYFESDPIAAGTAIVGGVLIATGAGTAAGIAMVGGAVAKATAAGVYTALVDNPGMGVEEQATIPQTPGSDAGGSLGTGENPAPRPPPRGSFVRFLTAKRVKRA